MINPSAIRSNITEEGGELRIIIPAARHMATILFLAVWLIIWAFSAMAAATHVFTSAETAPRIFVAVWLVIWIAGGIAACAVWLWNVFGNEIITVDGTLISIKKDVLGFGKMRQYQAGQVKNMRMSCEGKALTDAGGSRGGNLAFDYGAATCRFAGGIDEAEARVILGRILRRSPRLAPED